MEQFVRIKWPIKTHISKLNCHKNIQIIYISIPSTTWKYFIDICNVFENWFWDGENILARTVVDSQRNRDYLPFTFSHKRNYCILWKECSECVSLKAILNGSQSSIEINISVCFSIGLLMT